MPILSKLEHSRRLVFIESFNVLCLFSLEHSTDM